MNPLAEPLVAQRLRRLKLLEKERTFAKLESVSARNRLAGLENIATHYMNTLLRDAAVNAMTLIAQADGDKSRAAVLEQVEFFRRVKADREKSRQPGLVAAISDAIDDINGWVMAVDRVVELERKLARTEVES